MAYNSILLIWDIGVCLFILSATFGIGFALGGVFEARRLRNRLVARRLAS
jgi:hypothetical protein